MVIFLKKIILYAFLICSLGYTIIYIAVILNPGKMLGDPTEYEMWNFKKRAINSHYIHSKNVIIGDSRCLAGLNPQIIKHNSINFSLGGATAFEGYTTVKNFLIHSKIDTLIICYGIFHFTESDVLENRTLLFNFNSITDIANLEKVEGRYNISLDNQKPDYYLYLNRRATYFHLPTALRSTFIENFKQNSYNVDIIKSLKENSGYTMLAEADSSNDIDREVTLALTIKKFTPNPVIVSYLDSIYQISALNNIKLTMVIPPINYGSYKILKKTLFWQQYNNFLGSLKFRFPNMKIDNTSVYLPNSYFGDNSHLNYKGCNFFSYAVKKNLFNDNSKSNAIR